MPKPNGGFLINFEGGEGCGKTSQIPFLVEYLRQRSFGVYPTREPGGTSIGEQIREVIHSLRNTEMHPRTETLLFQAARAQLVEQEIKPSLDKGLIVICDRFFDSTMAYQGFGHGQDIVSINRLVEYATGGLTPDLTILLDVDVETGLKRKKDKAEWNRLDAYEIEFHQRVRAGYLKMAEADIDARWIVVDANNGIEEVRRDLIREVSKRLSLIGLIENEQRKIER